MDYLQEIPIELINILISYLSIDQITKCKDLLNDWESVYKLNYKYSSISKEERRELLKSDDFLIENNYLLSNRNHYFFDLYVAELIFKLDYLSMCNYFKLNYIPIISIYRKLKEIPKLIISKWKHENLKDLYLNTIQIKECHISEYENVPHFLKDFVPTVVDILTSELENKVYSLLLISLNAINSLIKIHTDILLSLKSLYLTEEIKNKIKEELITKFGVTVNVGSSQYEILLNSLIPS